MPRRRDAFDVWFEKNACCATCVNAEKTLFGLVCRDEYAGQWMESPLDPNDICGELWNPNAATEPGFEAAIDRANKAAGIDEILAEMG